uniref:Photosystem I reaction center subunit III n=1 Tax=Lactuca sativa TaxID=4236 RepID=A0A9R1VQ73_LACSA|nr:hypothetical protein LSAT_V11C400200720 [Lactuca sativa]
MLSRPVSPYSVSANCLLDPSPSRSFIRFGFMGLYTSNSKGFTWKLTSYLMTMERKGLLYGSDGLPHLIVSGDKSHGGEFITPGIPFKC